VEFDIHFRIAEAATATSGLLVECLLPIHGQPV